MVYQFFDKNTLDETVKNKGISKKKLAEELRKPIFRKSVKKNKYNHPSWTDIWGAVLANMPLISKFNKGIRFLLSAIDIFSKYTWVIPLKDKKGVTITNAFQKILKESNRKPNKIWVDTDSEFYNTSMKSWLEKNDIEMCSTHNEGKSVAPERFIRTLKNKTYIYMTSISKNLYIDKLDNILNKYNNTYHSTIKMKPVDAKFSTYIDSSIEINNKGPKFKVADIVRISKYKFFLQKYMSKLV